MSFARSLFTVSSLTIVSRVAGFVRDTLTARFLGAGIVADAFFAAQRLPNLFRSLFAEGAFSAAFVPLYTTEEERHGHEAAQQFAGEALALLLTVLIPFTALVIVLLVLAVPFVPEKYHLTMAFSAVTFPYLTLISVTALQTGVLNAQGRFGPGAAAPIALNLVLIMGLFAGHYLGWDMGYTLSVSLTLSGVVQMLWLAISCHRAGVPVPLILPKLGKTSVLLFRRIGPGAIGAGAAQINLLVSTLLALTLPTGAMSYLFYADRLNQLPLGIIGIAVATTLLPLLSRHVEAGKDDLVNHYMSRAVEFCLLLGLPATIGLGFAAAPIIGTLFEYGVFTHDATLGTAQALEAYAIGIPGFLLVKVFAAGFFARHDTKTPVQVAVVAMLVNVGFSLLLLHPLQHMGIALANSIAVWVNACLLYTRLRSKKFTFSDDKLRRRLPRILICAVGMSIVTYGLSVSMSGWFTATSTLVKLAALSVLIGISALAYSLLLHYLHAMRMNDVLAVLKRKSKISDTPQE